MSEDIPQVIFPSFQNFKLGFKLAIKINIKTGERFAFVSGEEQNLLVDSGVPAARSAVFFEILVTKISRNTAHRVKYLHRRFAAR